jgi:uncharacterized protein YdeI (YjbR/CyaY-like superfamily)
MIATDNFEKIEVTSQGALRVWLECHHAQHQSVWLVTFKKHTGQKYVSVGQVLDVLLCFGWIDGVRRKLDDGRTMQLISQRKNQAWAQSYKDRAARLIHEAVMHQSGFDAIATSKTLGLWNATLDVDALVMPDDLANALDKLAGASDNFNNAAPSYRRNVLRWIFNAKTDATRQKRINETASASHHGQKIPQL